MPSRDPLPRTITTLDKLEAVERFSRVGQTDFADTSPDAAAVRFANAFPAAAAVRGLAQAIPDADWPGRHDDNDRRIAIGQWQHRLELCARLLAAEKNVAHFPKLATYQSGENVPPNCSLFGSFEQMGPADLKQSAEFWDRVAGAATAQRGDGGVDVYADGGLQRS